jgi:stress response protein SCP2
MATKKLIAGEKVKIHDYVSAQQYEIHVQIESSMIIDVCCFGLDANRKLADDRYMVFYNQLSSPEGAIKLTASDQRKTVFLIQPHKLPAHIKNLVFTAAIDGNGTMSYIGKGYLAFFANSQEIFRFDFSGQNFQQERAVMVGELYFKEAWRLGAVGQGFNGGLSALLKHFGGEEVAETESNRSSPKSGFNYYYSKLDLPMQKAYQAMLEGFQSFSENINLSQGGFTNASLLSDLVEAVTLDNPALFFLARNYQYSVVKNEVWFKPKYLFDKRTIQEMQNLLSSQVDTIIKTVINNAMDDYAKELALHDYLVSTVVYDYDGFLNPNPACWEIYSVYGALINKKAVCEGFANAMKMLLDKCGIECLIVRGDSTIPNGSSSIGHAWNMVKIKNKFYHLDVTWDAPIGKKADEVFHYYFNLTDKEIAIDHSWNSKTPACHANEHNYFAHQGLNVSDDSTLKERLRNTIQHKKTLLSFRYTGSNALAMSSEKLNAVITDVWQNRGFLSRPFSSGSISWSVSYNDRQKVFKVVFNYG